MIKTLVTNVKDAAEQRWRFESKYVLIQGKNGAGKSGIIHGLEMACFGQVYDAAGKDMRAKRYIEFLGSGGEVRASILTNDLHKYEYGAKTAGYLNAIELTLNAMNGGSMALYKFLLEHVDNNMPLTVVHQKWEAQVENHGSYRKALLKMDEVVGKAIRAHRAKAKELDVAISYLGKLSHDVSDLITEKSDVKAQESRAKGLSEQIKREMRNFFLEVTPALEQEMIKYLPDGMGVPKFVGDTDVRLGFEHRPVPSGAETVALAIALAAVVLPMDKSVIIFPDRSYDATTLGAMMRAARSIPTLGVYVQSTVMPEGYEPEEMGWQILKL